MNAFLGIRVSEMCVKLYTVYRSDEVQLNYETVNFSTPCPGLRFQTSIHFLASGGRNTGRSLVASNPKRLRWPKLTRYWILTTHQRRPRILRRAAQRTQIPYNKPLDRQLHSHRLAIIAINCRFARRRRRGAEPLEHHHRQTIIRCLLVAGERPVGLLGTVAADPGGSLRDPLHGGAEAGFARVDYVPFLVGIAAGHDAKIRVRHRCVEGGGDGVADHGGEALGAGAFLAVGEGEGVAADADAFEDLDQGLRPEDLLVLSRDLRKWDWSVCALVASCAEGNEAVSLG